MGNKQSTKQPPQISVEDKMLLKKQVEQDKEERKNLRKEQDDARAADAAIQPVSYTHLTLPTKA